MAGKLNTDILNRLGNPLHELIFAASVTNLGIMLKLAVRRRGGL
jgi:hypothetical protein